MLQGDVFSCDTPYLPIFSRFERLKFSLRGRGEGEGGMCSYPHKINKAAELGCNSAAL